MSNPSKLFIKALESRNMPCKKPPNNLKEHPLRVLFDYGVKVTINSDDVLVFGQGVSKEYLDLYEAEVFNGEEINIIRKYGLASRGVIE